MDKVVGQGSFGQAILCARITDGKVRADFETSVGYGEGHPRTATSSTLVRYMRLRHLVWVRTAAVPLVYVPSARTATLIFPSKVCICRWLNSGEY